MWYATASDRITTAFWYDGEVLCRSSAHAGYKPADAVPLTPSTVLNTLEYGSDTHYLSAKSNSNALASTPSFCLAATTTDDSTTGAPYYISVFPPVLSADDVTPIEPQLLPDSAIEVSCAATETYGTCYERARLAYNIASCNFGTIGSCGTTTLTSSDSLSTTLVAGAGFTMPGATPAEIPADRAEAIKRVPDTLWNVSVDGASMTEQTSISTGVAFSVVWEQQGYEPTNMSSLAVYGCGTTDNIGTECGSQAGAHTVISSHAAPTSVSTHDSTQNYTYKTATATFQTYTASLTIPVGDCTEGKAVLRFFQSSPAQEALGESKASVLIPSGRVPVGNHFDTTGRRLVVNCTEGAG